MTRMLVMDVNRVYFPANPQCSIYSYEQNVLTEPMRGYADVARHDIYDGHKLTDPFIRELVMSFARTEDMDDG